MHFKTQHIFFFLAAGFLLSSCESEGPDATGSELTFAVSDGSRSTAISNLNTKGSTFAVWCDMKFKNNPKLPVFDNTVVEYGNGKWSYSGVTQYWFPKHEHSFVAVSPASDAGMVDIKYSDSGLSFSYNPNDYKSASDLMVATHRRYYDENVSGSASPISLSFHHIMSRIDFQLKNDKAADIVRVTQIKLEGVNMKGDFSIEPASLLSGSDRTDDYTGGKWTNVSNKGTLTADISVDVPENKTGSLFPDEDALFIVPQPGNTGVTMHITYELWDDGKKFEEHTLTADAPIGGWKLGNIYTYSMTISEITKEIELTVSVKNWQTPKPSGIEVPAT